MILWPSSLSSYIRPFIHIRLQFALTIRRSKYIAHNAINVKECHSSLQENPQELRSSLYANSQGGNALSEEHHLRKNGWFFHHSKYPHNSLQHKISCLFMHKITSVLSDSCIRPRTISKNVPGVATNSLCGIWAVVELLASCMVILFWLILSDLFYFKITSLYLYYP